jgi:hypothetical protein
MPCPYSLEDVFGRLWQWAPQIFFRHWPIYLNKEGDFDQSGPVCEWKSNYGKALILPGWRKWGLGALRKARARNAKARAANYGNRFEERDVVGRA